MHDTELIRLLRESPGDGLDALMDNYMGLVCAVVKARLADGGTAEDIEDCVSDVFAEFYRGADRVNLEKGTVKAYLCAIARNKAADAYLQRVNAPAQLSLDGEAAVDAFADEFTVEEAYLTEERRQLLAKAVAALGEPDHEIVVRKFYLREPSKSIAERLGMTVSAVDTRTHRALKKLKSRLEGVL